MADWTIENFCVLRTRRQSLPEPLSRQGGKGPAHELPILLPGEHSILLNVGRNIHGERWLQFLMPKGQTCVPFLLSFQPANWSL